MAPAEKIEITFLQQEEKKNQDNMADEYGNDTRLGYVRTVSQIEE